MNIIVSTEYPFLSPSAHTEAILRLGKAPLTFPDSLFGFETDENGNFALPCEEDLNAILAELDPSQPLYDEETEQ